MSDALLNPALAQGYETLSNNQDIVFVQYVRYVLPLDGYVFWLRVQQTTINGSLHITTTNQQNLDDSADINRVIFTTSQEINPLNDIAPTTMWIGQWRGVKFAFSASGPFYQNAGLFHYAGNAVYSYMESQLIDVGSQLPRDTLVVSNSLPAWFAIEHYTPIWLVPDNPGITLFPSYLIPDNIRPPYGVVHIDPGQIQGMQATPLLTRDASHYLLSTERVRVSLYGLTNSQASDWFDTVNRYSEDTSTIGMMSMPAVIRDEKVTQVELGVLAMKKTVEFEIAYNQSAIRDTARQLIEAASATVQTRELL